MKGKLLTKSELIKHYDGKTVYVEFDVVNLCDMAYRYREYYKDNESYENAKQTLEKAWRKMQEGKWRDGIFLFRSDLESTYGGCGFVRIDSVNNTDVNNIIAMEDGNISGIYEWIESEEKESQDIQENIKDLGNNIKGRLLNKTEVIKNLDEKEVYVEFEISNHTYPTVESKKDVFRKTKEEFKDGLFLFKLKDWRESEEKIWVRDTLTRVNPMNKEEGICVPIQHSFISGIYEVVK